MKRTLLFVALLSRLTLCIAVSYTGLSPVFTIDTKAPQVELHSPGGGELMYIGDSYQIEWTAADANLLADEIELFYSPCGVNYTPFASFISNSGTYLWEIPAQPSTSSRIRLGARDSFGNIGIAISEPFCISYAPPDAPIGINVEITHEKHAYISWEAASHAVPPDGYIILYSESPYEDDEHFYYFLGRSFTTNFTHLDVAEFRDQMFYRVIAYKNLRSEEDAALELLVEKSKHERISWPAAKAIVWGDGK